MPTDRMEVDTVKKIASVAWLYVERAPDLLIELIPGLLLIAGGILVMGVAQAVS